MFTPLKAFAHFIYGKGATATVPLEKTRLSPSPQKIPELQKMIDSAAIGKTEIDIRVNYDTFQDSFNTGAYLGNITLRIIGTIERNKEGKVTFSGQARAYNDIYDGNASTHRQIWAETLTTALRLVGEKNKATHYEIELPGSIPITYSN
ncbi:lipid II-degrading bacteriocin [Pseudomonas tussilaginis]|nr:lipid II-degrading bacteriocin [Pseudomonas sp. S11A 273]